MKNKQQKVFNIYYINANRLIQINLRIITVTILCDIIEPYSGINLIYIRGVTTEIYAKKKN